MKGYWSETIPKISQSFLNKILMQKKKKTSHDESTSAASSFI